MIIFEKILPLFLLPPRIYFLLSIVMIFFQKKGKLLFTINCVLVLLIYFMSSGFIVDIFLRSLENRVTPLNETNMLRGDAYVVLGGGLIENKRDTKYGATLANESLKRLIYANLLYKENQLPIIVSGGKSQLKKNNFSEGFIMAQYLFDLDVNRKDIIIESKSTNTLENSKYTAQLIKKFGFKNPILITSAYHMPRAIYAFEKKGVNVIPAPTDYHTEDLKGTFSQFFPDAHAM
jgi:uncharacterized SAM-binding protein YcdF (DUF218 family)